MAFSIDNLRNLIQTSIFGRRLGLDINEYLIGPRGVRTPNTDLSTIPTTITPGGFSRVVCSGSTQGPVQHFLPSPVPYIGTITYIGLATTTTGSHQFLSTANGASILAASDGTTKGVINLLGPGGVVGLWATGSAWQVVSSVSTGGVSYTTST